ncbi:hypothetical protein K1T71_012471 [Dendrolimus kikuchii]|uniref:Uncharacterized protein n=1 Tax=Dendrolimus kikuchii TaxID=765133 RepID=A0ACC1CJE5_9NEOP|nr:hypothetical protein K1T71_012471 [Dendrolimus kikuchii]
MFSVYYLSALVATYVCVVNGQSACNIPTGGTGLCVSIYECEVLLKLVQNQNRTAQELQLLQNSKCGEEVGIKILVCCPGNCTTPDGDSGRCIDVYSCPQLLNRLTKPLSQENRVYVQKSICQGSHEHSACCGPTPTSTTTTTTTTAPTTTEPLQTLTRNNFNDSTSNTCSNQEYTFPLDPSSKCCGQDSGLNNKIFGGTVVTIEMYPWLGVIEYSLSPPSSKVLCAGSLISSRYLLTAAHCITGQAIRSAGTPNVVRFGEFDTSNEGRDCTRSSNGNFECTDGVVRINVDKIIPHPGYTRMALRDDIGLLRLQTMARYTFFIRPICLPSYDITRNPPVNLSTYAAGWGATETSKSSTMKLHVELPYVELRICQEAYTRLRTSITLWNRQLCAGGQMGQDTCKGDSGGPLMYNNGDKYELLGVVSFGWLCGRDNAPAVYTKVFAYRDWINSTIAQYL